jgi:hypothetical protein
MVIFVKCNLLFDGTQIGRDESPQVRSIAGTGTGAEEIADGWHAFAVRVSGVGLQPLGTSRIPNDQVTVALRARQLSTC